MISNGSSKNIYQTTPSLPNVSEALQGWFQYVNFSKVVKRVVNYDLFEEEIPINFYGVVEPQSAQRIEMKPEGQRKWLYQTVWALPSLILTIDDVVIYNAIRYRVTSKNDWKNYGYVTYDLTQDFKPGESG
jgi:hypothetical protein